MVQGLGIYSIELTVDILLGVVLGIIINKLADFIGQKLQLDFYSKMFIQLILIIIVLYFMKIESKYLYKSWYGDQSYGIVFTSIFLSSQRNIARFIEKVYMEE